MSSDIEDNESTLSALFTSGGLRPGADLGPTDFQREGTYRRGYHQAITQVMFHLKNGDKLTAESLSEWVEGEGMTWRKDTPLDRHILAPALNKPIA